MFSEVPAEVLARTKLHGDEASRDGSNDKVNEPSALDIEATGIFRYGDHYRISYSII